MKERLRSIWAGASRAVWPQGLGGRTILVLSAAVVLVHLGTVLLYRDDLSSRADTVFASQVAGRLATAARALMDTDPQRRDVRAHALSAPGLDLHWSDHPTVEALPPGHSASPRFRRRILELAPDLGDVALQFGSMGSMEQPAVLNGSVRLPDDSFLNFGSTLAGAAAPWMFHATLLSTTLMAGGVVAVAAVLMRGLIRPLRRLAAAADAIGRGPEVAVAETGPREVRLAARAFNGMQERIHRLVDDRTQALAAVSHDLRTPITRLRLRAGFLPDQDMQAAVDADLDEMETMIEATLAYLRGDIESEPTQVTDLAALLSTLVDNLSDAGAAATYRGPDHVAVELHPSSAKRAFANLADNAVTYGGSVCVTLAALGSCVRVRVEDSGPGIPEADLDRVFQPFQRLDTSRNRRTGGVGLGLAIARRAIENEGGQVCLSNREQGGLCAEVRLPLAVARRPAPYSASTGAAPGAAPGARSSAASWFSSSTVTIEMKPNAAKHSSPPV